MTLRYDMVQPVCDIPVSEMHEGQIGIITTWPHGNYIGDVVKKTCGHLFGITESEYWSEIPGNEACRVRILPNGTTFTVVDNEMED